MSLQCTPLIPNTERPLLVPKTLWSTLESPSVTHLLADKMLQVAPRAGTVCRRSSYKMLQIPKCQQELEGEKLRMECVSSQARKITTQTPGFWSKATPSAAGNGAPSE